jgi:hypothetical protein
VPLAQLKSIIILQKKILNKSPGTENRPCFKAVNRGDKRTRRVPDRVFVKFERSRRDGYRCQEKKSRRGRARDPVFRDPPMPRTSPRSLFETPPPSPPHGLRLKPWI